MAATISEQPETPNKDEQALLTPSDPTTPSTVSDRATENDDQPSPTSTHDQQQAAANQPPQEAASGEASSQTDQAIISQLVIQPLDSPFAQMEAYLVNQLEKSAYYKRIFEEQGNPTLGTQFETYSTVTKKDLELLRQVWQDKAKLPKFKFEAVRVTSMPINIDIKEKQLHIIVRTMSLPVAEGAATYVIGEFEYPLTGKNETLAEATSRWAHSVKIEPSNLVCCTGRAPRQLDQVNSTTIKPFFDKNSGLTEYERALEFFVERGRSRTLKRKFKPIKLTFYERTSFLRCDKKLGTLQVKIDSINDKATTVLRLPIMDGRKQTDAMADIRVRVREPLVDKTPKTHEEKFLILT